MTLFPHLEMVPETHRRIWSRLAALTPMGFTLYGGTAVVLQLGNRQAKDLTFYSARPFVLDNLYAALPCLEGCSVEANKTNRFIARTTDDIRMIFTGAQPFGRVGEPLICAETGLQVASLRDLMAQKLRSLLERRLARDYMDLSAMIQYGLSIVDGLGDAAAMYGIDFKPMSALEALTSFECDAEVPRADRRVLMEAAGSVGLVHAGTVESYSLQTEA